jgi:serine/threonine protein phosphatase PrpC
MCGVGLPQESLPDEAATTTAEAANESDRDGVFVEAPEAEASDALEAGDETQDLGEAPSAEAGLEPEGEDLPEEGTTAADSEGEPNVANVDEPEADREAAAEAPEAAGEAPDEESPVLRGLEEEETVPADLEPEVSGIEDAPEELVTEIDLDAQMERLAAGPDLAEGPGEEEPATEPAAQVEEVPTKESAPEPGVGEEAPDLPADAGEGLVPVPPGTTIDGRYLLAEAMESSEAEILYPAQDLLACWQCGFVAETAGESYCVDCGAALGRHLEVQILQVADEEAGPSGGQAVASRLAHEDRFFLILADREAEPEQPEERPERRLLVGQRSDVGQVRELDEDSTLIMTVAPNHEGRTGPVLGLYAVADGMGGHEGGEVASKLALQVLADRALRNIILPQLSGETVLDETILYLLEEATSAANDAVYLGRQKRDNDMGTTLTTAFICDDRLFLAHVGDCRAYRWNAEGLSPLTTDHSLVASMIATGQVAPEEIYTHPHRSVIYRCIGDQPVVEVDTSVELLAPGDRVILCSDGLWEMVRDEGIEDVMLSEADPQIACDILVHHANLAGGDDNISVIVVQVEAT